MNREQQDLNWKSLPRETREEIRAEYQNAIEGSDLESFLQDFFGHHNLTSDTEPEEIEYNQERISLQMYQHLAGYWIASYVKYSGNELIHQKPLCAEKELIDALNSLLIWCIDNGHIKLKEK